MSSITIDLEEDLVALLHRSNQPLHSAVRELIVLELYRQGLVSSGKAAQRLNMGRWEFVQHAARLGIPYFDMTADEWTDEQTRSATL
jgi:predicted HTH domain antitoxin